MPFPHHDRYWTAVATFLQSEGLGTVPTTAPAEFADLGGTVYAYTETYAEPPPTTPVVVVHKGLLGELQPEFLEHVQRDQWPTFANEVFVVFAAVPHLPPLPADSVHVQALTLALETQPKSAGRSESLDRPAQPVVPFATLSVAGVREEMNRRYARSDDDHFGGYEHPHHWDQVRYGQVNRVFANLVGDVTGQCVLEIGCGIGRNTDLCQTARTYLGIDIADAAISKARVRFAGRPHLAFRQMDAMNLDLPSASFDLVLGVEIVEHVQDVERFLAEVWRVLAPGGRFLFNSANRDSLHLRLVRALGLPEYRSTHEHFREFGYPEMLGLLAGVGFTVEMATGIFLQPYLNVPGIAADVQTTIREHPELVEVLRFLGERVGPEYGYEFALVARKPEG